MRNCAVFNCRTTTGSKEYIFEKLSFHCFPNNSSLSHIWMLFCRSQKPINSKTARICSKHFVSEDFLNNVQYEMGYSSKRLLKPDALPSIYVDSNESTRSQIQARKSLVDSLLQEKKAEEESSAEESVFAESMVEDNEFEEEVVEDNEFEEGVVEESEFEEEEPEETVELIEVEEEDFEEDECINMEDVQSFDILNPSEKVDDLTAKFENIKQENMCLILVSEKYKLEIQSLKKKLEQSEFHRNNMEKRLEEIFTPGQVKKLKNGSKRLQWVEADIARATALHSASPEAYDLLRSKNYPLPSARTLRTWTHKLKNPAPLNEKKLRNPTIAAIKRLERILTVGTSDSEDNVLEPTKDPD